MRLNGVWVPEGTLEQGEKTRMAKTVYEGDNCDDAGKIITQT